MTQMSLPLLLSIAAAFSPAFSAPTRTNCRCSILSTSNDLASYSAVSKSQSDICANLGPSLEYFRHREPEVFSSYFERAKPRATPTDDDLQPLSTSVLLELAARRGHQGLGEFVPIAPTERPRERIVCRSEPEAFTEFHDSQTTLFALQVIVAMAFLACIAEFVTLCFDWFWRPKQEAQPLRLTGEEQRLTAYSAYSSLDRRIPSPSEKQCTYAAHAHLDEDDEDDEINRPVM